MKAYKHVSACPTCGAPIYETRGEALSSPPEVGIRFTDGPPEAYFTCTCRTSLPAALPDVPADAPAELTVEEADRQYVERQREKVREVSAERVDG